MNWDSFDFAELAAAIRETARAADAERTIWAFEEAVRVARIDPELLPHVLAAVTCVLARLEDVSPRDVLEAYFRRSVTDEQWRERYLPLFE